MQRTLLLIAVLTLATGAVADEGDLSLRIYDVSVICAPRIPQFGPRLGSTPSNYVMREEDVAEPVQFLPQDNLIDIIRQRVEPESWDMEGAEISARENRIFVRHRVHILKRVEELLDAIALAASRRVRFEVSLYGMDWSGGIGPIAGKPFVPPAGAERLESGSVETYPGVATTFKITNRLRLLKDYDVEIAENSAIADPIVEAADEGLVIDLVPHPTMDGDRVLVEARVQQGTFERPIPRLSLSENRKTLLGAIDLPVFRQAYAHATPIVTSGGEFTLPFVVGSRLLMVRVKATVLGRGGSDWLLDVGALTRPQSRYMVGYDPETEEEWRDHCAPEMLRLYDDDGLRPMGATEELAELILNYVDPWYWEEEGSLEMAENGQIVYFAKPEVMERVRRFVSAREKDALSPLRVDLEVVSVAAPVESGVAAKLPEGAVVRSATSVKTIPGKEACVLLGRTRNFVSDYGVEVAQSSKIADPIIGQSFTGLAANFLPRLSRDGGTVRLDLAVLLAYLPKTPKPATDPEADYLGSLEQLPENRRVFNTTLEFPRGSLYVFDGGPDPVNADRRLAIAVRVTGE